MKENSYYRKITELLPNYFKNALSGDNLSYQASHFALLFLIIVFIFSGIYLFLSYIQYQELKQKRAEVAKELVYWEDVVKKQPNSPDAYYQAAYYSVKLGDRVTAEQYLSKALVLDPDFVDAIKLQEELN